jgi:ketosteroid isomerase-like protein
MCWKSPCDSLSRMDTPGHEDQGRLVEQFAAAIHERDADAIAALLHPDVELRLYSAEEPIIGREAAREWYRTSFQRRLSFEGDATPGEQDESSVVMRGRLHWFGEGSGRDQPGEWRITFRDGLIDSVTAARSDG